MFRIVYVFLMLTITTSNFFLNAEAPANGWAVKFFREKVDVQIQQKIHDDPNCRIEAVACLAIINDWLDGKATPPSEIQQKIKEESNYLTKIALAICLGYGFEKGIDPSISLPQPQYNFYRGIVESIGKYISKDSKNYAFEPFTCARSYLNETPATPAQIEDHVKALKELLFRSNNPHHPIFTGKLHDRIKKFEAKYGGEIQKEKAKILYDNTLGNVSSLSGSRATAIYRLKTRTPSGNKMSYIIIEGYDVADEKLSENIEKWKKIISEYSKNNSAVKLPELTSYYDTQKIQEKNDRSGGNEAELTLIQRAYGKQLCQIQEEMQTLSDDQAIEMGKTIGEQMGHLTRAFFLKNKTFLKHGDLGGQNFMYSQRKRQFYWIDLDGTSEIPYQENKDMWGNYPYLSSEGTTILYIWSAFDVSPSNIFYVKEHDPQNYQLILKVMRRKVLARDAFYNAYVNLVKDLTPYQFQIKNEEKITDCFINLIKNLKDGPYGEIKKFKEIFDKKNINSAEAKQIIDYIYNGGQLPS